MAKLTASTVVTHPETGEPTVLLAGRELPAWAEPLVGGHLTGALQSGEDRYDGLKVADLKAEIDKRNADREDDAKLSSDGNKADLIAALKADDES